MMFGIRSPVVARTDTYDARQNPMNILAISGSLRMVSLNSTLLRAATRVAPDGIAVIQSHNIGDLPLFNPDIEASDPAPVASLRAQIIASDALVIASPEYAHGVTGALKNALDWMVGNESFVNKPVAVLNASSRAKHADASLREIVNTMSAHIVEAASITVPLVGSSLTDDDIVQHPEMRPALIASMQTLRDFVAAGPTGIRQGTRHDFPTLAAIEHAADGLFPEGRIPSDGDTYPAQDFERAIHNGLLWVAQVDHIAVGFAVCEVVEDNLHLYAVAVHPTYGKRGIGKQLVLEVIEESVRRKLTGVTLTTFEDLRWNAPFYEKLGFRILPKTERTAMLDSVLAKERALGMSSRVAMFFENDV